MENRFSLAGPFWACIILAIAYMVIEAFTGNTSSANEVYTAAAIVISSIQEAVNRLLK